MIWIIVLFLISVAGFLYGGYLLARLLEELFHIHLL